MTEVFAVVRVIVEPLGWFRLLAVPPALVVAFAWFWALAIGPLVLGAVGAPRQRPDVATLLYSIPELILVAVTTTLLVASPLVVRRLARRD